MNKKQGRNQGGEVLSPWNISGRAGYFGILTLNTHTPPTTPKIPELVLQGTYPKVDFGPYQIMSYKVHMIEN